MTIPRPTRFALLAAWLPLGLAADDPAPTPEAPAAAPAPAPPPAPAGTRRALIVCGLPGDAAHRALYAGVVEKLAKALTERHGFPAGEVLVRFGDKAKAGDGPALSGARGLSDREGLDADAAELRKRLAPEDTLWVIVIGHAHFDGRHSYLNLPGPDPSDEAFGATFRGVKAREQIFFLTTSASGFFIRPLSAPGRVVITATEPDQEVNETVFPLALADVLAAPPAPEADLDKDGAISALELFVAVAGNTLKRYADAEEITTEHAQLDDNGDGRGTEVQLNFLPPELGGRAGGKGPTPTIGPKDDGALASKIRVEALPPPEKPPAEPEKPATPKETGP